MKLTGKTVYIKLLTTDDVSDAYVNWMSDFEITQYLESRWKSFTLDDIKSFVKSCCDNPYVHLFGIFCNKTNEHIGNIKIDSIDPIHRFCYTGLLVGNRNYWGKGVATEAINLVTDYAFTQLNLNKVVAGIYENNIGSYKAFLKCGYTEAGRLKKHYFCSGVYVDKILVEKSRVQ